MSAARSTKVFSRAARAIESFLPAQAPPSLDKRAATLPQVLSRYPNDGVGVKVHQCRWGHKGIANSYYLVTRSQLKLEGKHGKAWGKLYWKGKAVSETDEKIPGSLKYNWTTGPSTAVAPIKIAAPLQQIQS
ncbi:hypothetical protein FIBSPDRAFT_1055071 [Athelia psychrophila]|uniref:Uncharacterized protein n=1 Tax=Athelia psychrophila TaxID=1759441 RepID=A0A167UCT8_9AGAM|nr:hypothetical protein FIBSPDRAFT_1055071 [Fibularhizoctonia sp. CBS 109695]